MVFSNLLFIYLFLPLNLLCCYCAKSIEAKNRVLLVFSLFFYAWGEPVYVFLLIGMALADYFFALGIEKNRGTGKAKLWLAMSVIVSIGLIGVFKYGTFVCENTNALFGAPSVIPQIALPIGISFYTFQLLSYVVDVYRGDVEAQPRFSRVLLYASLFHQCIAGPIVRYKDVSDEIAFRQPNIVEAGKGVNRFAVGLAKKVLLSNVCGSLCDTLLLSDSVIADTASLADNLNTLASRSALALWLGMAFYMLQIYLDFSAYSDMAIGMGMMVGFHYKENFNYPYISKSVTEFWRRWHMSLGTFFRDYVYIPLGGNRKGMARTILNMLVVWALTGLWHGASWNFVLWGLYFFVFLVLEKLFLKKVLEKLPSFVSRIYLLIVVYFGWILFKFRSVELGMTVFKGLFGLNGNGFTNYETTAIFKNYIFFLVVAVIASTPLIKNLGITISKNADNEIKVANLQGVFQIVIPVVLLLLSTLALVGDSYNPFLYFQF